MKQFVHIKDGNIIAISDTGIGIESDNAFEIELEIGEEPFMQDGKIKKRKIPQSTIDNFTLNFEKDQAKNTITKEHSRVLVELTGNASIEERDTWQAKAIAAEALLAGNATETQQAMLGTEASITGQDVQDLAQVIVGKYQQYQSLIGLASGLKRKALKAVDACKTVDEIQQVLESIKTEVEQALSKL